MSVLLVYVLILAAAALLTFAAVGESNPPVSTAAAAGAAAAADGEDWLRRTAETGVHPSAERRAEGEVSGGPNVEQSRAGASASSNLPPRRSLFGRDSSFAPAATLPAQQRRMLSFLEDHCEALPVRAASTHALAHPTEFYNALTRLIRTAKHSIFFSALYIGDGPLSTAFVQCLEERIRSVVAQHEERLATSASAECAAMSSAADPLFEIGILLDYNRMQDRRNLLTVQKLLTTAHGIARRYHTEGAEGGAGSWSPVKVRLHLYQGPCRWNRLFAPLSRAKEVLGVQHTKIFVFDEQHVVLTGANLSDDYFSTRMDRYMVFERNPLLSYYFLRLLHVLFAVSHPVVSLTEYAGSFHGATSDLVVEPRSPLDRLTKLIGARKAPAATGTAHAADGDDRSLLSTSARQAAGAKVLSTHQQPHRAAARGSPTLHVASSLVVLPNATGCDPSLETAAYARAARALCLRFMDDMHVYYHNRAYDLLSQNPRLADGANGGGGAGTPAPAAQRQRPEEEEEEDTANDYDSVVFPTVQFGRVGIFHDSTVVSGLLSLASDSDHVYLTSPYLNMYADFLDTVIGKRQRESAALKADYPIPDAYSGKPPATPAPPPPLPPSSSSLSPSSCGDNNGFYIDCITASVRTNGWNGQGGMAGYIPYFYLQLERAFFYLVKAYGCLSRVRIREFTQKGLTFHAKGLYFVDRREAAAAAAATAAETTTSSSSLPPSAVLPAAPYLVAYGSTNYGNRSVHKDVEVEGFLFTFERSVRAQTQEELSHLLSQSSVVHERQFTRRHMGRFQPVVSLLAQMGQDFL